MECAGLEQEFIANALVSTTKNFTTALDGKVEAIVVTIQLLIICSHFCKDSYIDRFKKCVFRNNENSSQGIMDRRHICPRHLHIKLLCSEFLFIVCGIFGNENDDGQDKNFDRAPH
ncbi:hypothetical protein TNCV_3576451 [Trichonephila clavipes]|nr:hypothetical protein TNCV_3576451 [Trichonephila clavipes]